MTEKKKESPVALIIFIVGFGVLLYLSGGNFERVVSDMKAIVIIIALGAFGFHYGYTKLAKEKNELLETPP